MMNKNFTIFLDIDGVLSNHNGVVENWKEYKFKHSRKIAPCFNVEDRRDHIFGHTAMICPYNVEEFNIFCRSLGIENIDKIVISSTWRLGHSLGEISTVLYLQGLEYEIAKKIKDKTKSISVPVEPYASSVGYTKRQRALEIETYISDNKLVKDYCIVLDDIQLDDLLGYMYYDLCDYIKGFEYDGLKEKWIKD